MTMGERIKAFRIEHGMTQAELGKVLGVGRSAILKYEKGEVSNIPASKIKTMSDLFGVTPSHLMGFGQYNEEDLAEETKLIEKIQARWGKNSVLALNMFVSMNEDGQKIIMNALEDYSSMPKYQKVQGGSR